MKEKGKMKKVVLEYQHEVVEARHLNETNTIIGYVPHEDGSKKAFILVKMEPDKFKWIRRHGAVAECFTPFKTTYHHSMKKAISYMINDVGGEVKAGDCGMSCAVCGKEFTLVETFCPCRQNNHPACNH